ncbi:TRAP transporter small permease [Polaromonas sp. CG_23.6]|uniref:TRAP transporter small permease n=1 Tax=Polaromonas sp. CG_23.6 TaxID=2760709 RepID=UPI00247557BA|nr:TRAP transporter small permease [Polaromonas sp. CG_23.6]MDH6183112.1 TRAP-type C4-dicarboxylate transport system permease small subunit [Polaromonas sp. CG_23.6]
MSDKIISDDGEFHTEDEEFDLSTTTPEAWLALAFFWLLGLTVFYQFITRYVFNDSAAWTEEIARYQLIAVVFIGAAIGVVKNNHIHVDFFYRHMPTRMGRLMSGFVDWVRIAFFAAAVVMTVQMMLKIGNQTRMTVVDLPMNIVYGLCLLGFAVMLLRSVQVAVVHYRRGYSVLERPDSTMQDR